MPILACTHPGDAAEGAMKGARRRVFTSVPLTCEGPERFVHPLAKQIVILQLHNTKYCCAA